MISSNNLGICLETRSHPPPAMVEVLKIDQTPDEKSECVRLLNYSLLQCTFLQKRMNGLLETGHVHRNKTYARACAQVLVAKSKT